MEFEWDEDKAAENLRKHAVSFSQAALAFHDPLSIELVDEREDYGESRFIHIGLSDALVLTVVFTERAQRIRIISARKATKDEEAYYHSQNAF